MMSYDIYLAGPFFTPEQKSTMKQAKEFFEGRGFSVCDPQDLSPVIVDLPPEERKEKLFKGIFKNNIEAMEKSEYLVACIDDRDTGTSFEMGFFYAFKGPGRIFTFSAHGYGANVMLSQATTGHAESLDLLSIIDRLICNGEEGQRPVSEE